MEQGGIAAEEDSERSVVGRADELERENAELRLHAQHRTAHLAGLTGWVIAFLVWCLWTTPLGLADADAPSFGAGNVLLAVVLGGFAQGLLTAWAEDGGGDARRRLVVLVLALPLTLVVAGAVVHHKHTWYDRGREAFTAYTGRFPSNALGEPSVMAAAHSVVTVCAPQLRTPDTHFCVETTTAPKYKFDGPTYGDINGSYRFRSSEQPEGLPNGFLPLTVFDCSGSASPCEVKGTGA